MLPQKFYRKKSILSVYTFDLQLFLFSIQILHTSIFIWCLKKLNQKIPNTFVKTNLVDCCIYSYFGIHVIFNTNYLFLLKIALMRKIELPLDRWLFALKYTRCADIWWFPFAKVSSFFSRLAIHFSQFKIKKIICTTYQNVIERWTRWAF